MRNRKTTAGLDAIETASQDELQALQRERMAATLRHAYENSPVYRKKFTEHGVSPDDFKDLSDLSRFPFTVKDDFRQNYPFGMFAVPMDQIIRIHASSGTTGKSTVVGYTRNDIDIWSQVVARSIYAAGGRPGEQGARRIRLWFVHRRAWAAHYGAERLGCAVIPMSGGQTEKQAMLIRDFDPDIIMVTPSYMLNITDELERQGTDTTKLSLRCGIFGAEPWTGSMRKELEERLAIDAVDIYGLSEIMGPGISQECVESKGGADDMGGLFLSRDHFTGNRRAVA